MPRKSAQPHVLDVVALEASTEAGTTAGSVGTEGSKFSFDVTEHSNIGRHDR